MILKHTNPKLLPCLRLFPVFSTHTNIQCRHQLRIKKQIYCSNLKPIHEFRSEAAHHLDFAILASLCLFEQAKLGLMCNVCCRFACFLRRFRIFLIQSCLPLGGYCDLGAQIENQSA